MSDRPDCKCHGKPMVKNGDGRFRCSVKNRDRLVRARASALLAGICTRCRKRPIALDLEATCAKCATAKGEYGITALLRSYGLDPSRVQR